MHSILPVLIAVLASMVAASSSEAATPTVPAFAIEKLADGIYAAIRQEPPGLMVDANALFIVNDTDVVVVDAPEASAAMIAALRKITDKPVSFLVNTHWHDDHIIGNAAWRAAYPDVRFIGHAALRDYLPTTGMKNREGMISGAPQFAAQMQAQMDHGKNLRNEPIDDEERASYASDIALVGHYMRVVPGAPIVLPDIAVHERLTLHRGARTIEVMHPGHAHTAGDLIVWLPHERIVATGDVVAWPIPLVGSEQSDVRRWIGALDAVLALKPAILVPGHGPVFKDARHARLMRDLYADIVRQVDAGVARRDTLEQIRKTIDLAPWVERLAGDSKVRRFSFGMYVAGPAVESAYRAATADGGKP